MALKEQVANEVAREYVTKVLEATGLDATNLARKLKISPSTITGIMAPSPRTRTTRLSTLRDIEQLTGLALPVDLRSDIPDPAYITRQPFRHDVHIYPLLAVPGHRFYHWNQMASDFAPRLPGIFHAKGAVATRMPDRSMEGWRRPNELIYLDPGRTAVEGDHALFEIANTVAPNGPSLYVIRRLISADDHTVTLGGWGNKPTDTPIKRSEIISMLRAVEWPELIFG
jgi:hypothetical protein